jgi:hypothetical protein
MADQTPNFYAAQAAADKLDLTRRTTRPLVREQETIMTSGIVMGRAADTGGGGRGAQCHRAVILLATRLNPIWLIAAGGALGGLGLL